jgi:hypothetical protein
MEGKVRVRVRVRVRVSMNDHSITIIVTEFLWKARLG